MEMLRITGFVSVVQEQRFLLATRAGREHLCVLVHDASLADGSPAEAGTLELLAASGQLVTVECAPSAHLLAYAARRLYPA